MRGNPTWCVHHQNGLASTFALTNTIGQVVEGYLYEAFGRQTVFTPGPNGVVAFGGDDVVIVDGSSAVDNPFLYTGRRLALSSSFYGRFTKRKTAKDILSFLRWVRSRYPRTQKLHIVMDNYGSHIRDAVQAGTSVG